MPTDREFRESFHRMQYRLDEVETSIMIRFGILELNNSSGSDSIAETLRKLRSSVHRANNKLRDSKGDLEEIHLETEQIHRYEQASVISEGVAHMGESIFNAVNAFRNGRQYEGASETLRAAAGLSQVIMMGAALAPVLKLAGPLSAVLTNCAEMLVFILQDFEKQDEPLIEQLEARLRTVIGEEHEHALSALVELFAMQSAQLLGYPVNSIDTWTGVVNCSQILGGGGELVKLFTVKGWLDNEDNQKLDVWEDVYEGYLSATREFLSECDTAIALLKKTKKVENSTEISVNADEINACANFMLAYAKTEKKYIDSLDELSKIRGRFWGVGIQYEIFASKILLDKSADWSKELDRGCLALRSGPNDRLWVLGGDGRINHKVAGAGSWAQLPDSVAANVKDIAIGLGRDPGVNAVTWLNQNGVPGYCEFRDEEYFQFRGIKLDETKQLVTGVDPPYQKIDKHKLTAICADDDGRLFGITNDKQVIMSDADRLAPARIAPDQVAPIFIQKEGGIVPRLISAGGGILAIVGTREILCVRISSLDYRSNLWMSYTPTAWSTIPVPPGREGASNWDYDSITTMANGSIITTIGGQIHLWHGGKWRADTRDNVRLRAVCGRPLGGWAIMRGVKERIGALEKMEKLKSQPPA